MIGNVYPFAHILQHFFIRTLKPKRMAAEIKQFPYNNINILVVIWIVFLILFIAR